MFRIKICGITTPHDARLATAAGADAIGINFYAGSKRYVEPQLAKKIGEAAGDSLVKVGVFVNSPPAEIRRLEEEVPLDYVQLHGDEGPQIVAELSDLRVIKAFRCRNQGFDSIVRFLSECGDNSKPPRCVGRRISSRRVWRHRHGFGLERGRTAKDPTGRHAADPCRRANGGQRRQSHSPGPSPRR